MRWLGGWLLAPALACSCGGSDDPADGGGAGSSTAGTSARGGAAGTSSSGGASGAPVAGSGGAAGSGTAGTAGGGMASVRCEGNFGAPSVVFELPGQTLGSLSLGPGELELIYATSPIGQDPQPQSYRRSLRASTSVPFSAGEPLPELDAACGDATLLRSGDLSLDGLRYYFVCYPTIEIYETPLRLARRASLDAPFVVEQQTYGEVYPGPTLGPDELELLTSPSTNGETPSMRYLRSGQSAEFVLASSSPSGVILRTPEISPDGRFVFGTTRPDGTPTALVMAERAAGATAFGMPVTLTQARAASDALGSAAISGDCRSLYYVEIAVDQTTSPSTQTNRVLVMKR